MILGLVITLLSLGFTAFVFIKFALPMMKSANNLMTQLAQGAADRNALLASGAPGQARVLNLQGTGTLVNHDPQVLLDLEVHPATGAAPFRARCTAIVSQLQIPRVQPGCAVPVRFDPANLQRVALAI